MGLVRGLVRRLFVFFFLLMGAALGAGAWWLTQPLSLRGAAALELEIAPGTSAKGVAQAVIDAGVDSQALLLYAWFRLSGKDRLIKAGNYEIPPGTTPYTLLIKLAQGQENLQTITLVEGWNWRQVRAALGLALDYEWMNRQMFYGAYRRVHGLFGNTACETQGSPSDDERTLLEPWRAQLPPEVFGPMAVPPSTDPPASLRANLRQAQALLQEAGWQIEGGVLRAAHVPGVPAGTALELEYMDSNEGGMRVVAQHKSFSYLFHWLGVVEAGTLEDIIVQTAKLLKNSGKFYLVHRPFRLAEIFSTLKKYHLEPKRMQLVYPFVDKEPNMVLIEAMKGGNPRITVQKPLIVYETPGVYTKDIRELYGDGR